MKAKMVILAGGQGTRLKPITDTIQKSMILINDKPFLQYQLELLKKNNITDVVIVVGYMWEQVTNFVEDGSKFGMNIRCVFNRYPDALISLYNSRHLLADDFIVMYGDSYLDFNYNALYAFHQQKRLLAENKDVFITMAICKTPDKRYDGNIVQHLRSNRIEYSKNGFYEAYYMDYGASAINQSVFGSFEAAITRHNLTLAGLLKVVSANYMMEGFIIQDRFYEIGSHTALQEFERLINDSNKDSI